MSGVCAEWETGSRESQEQPMKSWAEDPKSKKIINATKTQYFFANRGGGCGGWAGPVTLLGRSPGVTQAT